MAVLIDKTRTKTAFAVSSEIMSLNPDNATAVHDEESREQNWLCFLAGRDHMHSLSPVSHLWVSVSLCAKEHMALLSKHLCQRDRKRRIWRREGAAQNAKSLPAHLTSLAWTAGGGMVFLVFTDDVAVDGIDSEKIRAICF